MGIIFKDPKEAPKDQMILAYFKNHPGPNICIWNKAEDKWAVSVLQTSLYRGEWNDHYFETELFCFEDMENWRELPRGK